MTREEHIVEAARTLANKHCIAEMDICKKDKQNYSYSRIYDAEVSSFEAGVKWADQHPDISHIWYNSNEEPSMGNIYAYIMYTDIYNTPHMEILCNILEYRDSKITWDEAVKKNRINKWTYVLNLLPK